MAKWLEAALDYLPRWLEFQMRLHEQPGCAVAVAYKGKVVLEEAFGYANLAKKERLTPRHRFRVASHSKSFTAAGILKLAEQRKLRLEDRVGRHVGGLHPAIARATIAQLLSHSAGIVRDGPDSGQFQNRRPFLNERELRAQLAAPPILRASTRFKYSNHGYGLAGFVIQAVTGEPFLHWIEREVVAVAGLRETWPDMPLPKPAPFARGHSSRLPVGRRLILPGDFPTNAIAPAAGVVSTAADLARYFSQLSPRAPRSFLSAASRRRMVRRDWRDPHSSLERYYGLGIISGSHAGWDWFGHSGGLLGCITRTVVVPKQDLAVSVLTNAADGFAHFWLDGALQILSTFADHGAPSRRASGWTGRWWSGWGAFDLVPMGGKVLVAAPAYFNPFLDASQIRLRSRNEGVIALAGGYASHGEPARLRPGRELQLGGGRFIPEAKLAREMLRRYREK